MLRHDARPDKDDGGGGACAGIGFPVVETKCPYRHADGERERADEPTCKGWACRIEFPTPGADDADEHEQFWTDSDGVRPEIPGCHQEWRTNQCADHEFLKANFGEACVGDLLIETNPGAGVCHPHELAIMGEFKGEFVGHPDVYSCPEFCILTGHARGKCVAVPNFLCEDGTRVDSAMCDCSRESEQK